MQKRLWFDIAYTVAAVLVLGMAFMAVVYAAGENGIEDAPPIVEMIPYAEAERWPQPGQAVEEVMPIVEEQYGEDKGIKMCPVFSYGKAWSNEDKYLLAKIAMAESEGSSIQCMTLVIMAVLNRVESDLFPASIYDVIFQYDEATGLYQFSCIGNGRWDRVEPDQSCYEAVSIVQNAEYDYSGGALYFESCEEEDNWHSRNLDFLYQCGELRFYK